MLSRILTRRPQPQTRLGFLPELAETSASLEDQVFPVGEIKRATIENLCIGYGDYGLSGAGSVLK